MSDEKCAHIKAITTVKGPKRYECEECVKIGARWVHLRTCQECDATLCCDDSPNRHASRHARKTSHPVIASAEPGERWLYCFPDDQFVEVPRVDRPTKTAPRAGTRQSRQGPARHPATPSSPCC